MGVCAVIIILSHSPGEPLPPPPIPLSAASGHQSGDWTVLGVGLGPLPTHNSLLWMEVPGGSGRC